MNKTVISISLVATLSGCCGEIPAPDQCARRELFKQCMKALPAGPQDTVYNDWDEVVSECENVAHLQSMRPKSQIKEECK